MCAMSDLSVVTRTHEQEVGTRLTYDREGKLVGQEVCPRAQGTTVAAKDLFKALPVRYKVRGVGTHGMMTCTYTMVTQVMT